MPTEPVLTTGEAHVPAFAEGQSFVFDDTVEAPLESFVPTATILFSTLLPHATTSSGVTLSATYLDKKLTVRWAGIPIPWPQDWIQVWRGNGERAAWCYTNGKTTTTKKSVGIASGTVTLTPKALSGWLRITLQSNHGAVVLASVVIQATERRVKDRRV